jgi:putative acetyltransferase
MKVLHRLAKLEDTKRLFDIRRRSIIELASQRMTSAEASAWVEKLTVAGMERKLHELEIWVAEASAEPVGWLHPGQAYCTSLALADRLSRTVDRIDQARVC